MDHAGRTNRELARLEAARWVLRLSSGNCSAAEREEFEAWRKASLHHEVIYQWESLVWDRTERLKALRPADENVDPLLLASMVAGEQAPPPSRFRRALRRFGTPVALGASLAATLLLAIGATLVFLDRSGEATVYATAIGERRIVDLEDGSRLELNTNTEVAVRFSRAERHVALLRGESLFDVQSDASRPFNVDVGASSVRAVGTAFNIRRDADSTRILVTEGVVEVTGLPGSGRAPFNVRLPAGSIAIDGSSGLVSRVIAEGELERALSWRFGAIILSGETLSQAAAEFNRYNAQQIEVADPAIAGLRLGGYFNARDVDSFVEVLASTYALDVAIVGETVALRGTAATESRVRDNGMAVRSM